MKTGPQSLPRPPVIIFLIKILSFAANHFVWPAANQLQDKDGLQIRTLGFVLVSIILVIVVVHFLATNELNWRLIYFTAPSCGVCSLLQWNVNKLVGRKESPRHPPNVVAASSSSFVSALYSVYGAASAISGSPS